MARKAPGEPAFGSDSFLDVIANLVGIVLIIIVMVGARIRELPTQELAAIPSTPAAENPPSPDQARLQTEVREQKRQLAELQARLLATLRAIASHGETRRRLATEKNRLEDQRQAAADALVRTRERLAMEQRELAKAEESRHPLEERIVELKRSMAELETLPPERKVVHYHLPVSKPVGVQELLFECKAERVTYADLPTLLDQVAKELPEKGEQLRTRWEVTGTAGPVGAFRMHYTLMRDRSSPLDTIGDLGPVGNRFSYGLARWELEPVWIDRGERAADAVREGSRFRRIIDAVDPELVALTFFVYPDSFELYRELRDYLYGRGFVVAGRPLPPGTPIAGSRSGTVSRGQ